MTLSLATITSSGIILSADSRQTYRNMAGMVRIGSDSAMKLFKLNSQTGLVIAGTAFIKDDKGTLKGAGWYVNDFKKEIKKEKLSIKEIAEKLNIYFDNLYIKKQIEELKKNIKGEIEKQGCSELKFDNQNGVSLPYSYKDKKGEIIKQIGSIEPINFIIAGVDDDKICKAYMVYTPDGINNEKTTKKGGAMWIGQTDVLQRIIGGFAPEIGELDFIKEELKKKIPVEKELQKLEYIINWGTMTLQDAIDFCILITRTTENIQRFSDGTQLRPGGITGVGGDIDVAAITPEKGFVWLKKKKLDIEGEEIDL